MKSGNDATKMNVLLAEDDPNDVFFIARAFSMAGMEVDLHLAADGQEMIDYLAKTTLVPTTAPTNGTTSPDLVIMDLKMPRLNGFQVIEWIRANFEWDGLPLVVLSSSSLPEDIDRAYALGADLYEVKPNDPAALIATVRRLRRLFVRGARATNHRIAVGR